LGAPLDAITTSSKAEDDRQTPGNAADDLGQFASETYRLGCKKVSKVSKLF